MGRFEELNKNKVNITEHKPLYVAGEEDQVHDSATTTAYHFLREEDYKEGKRWDVEDLFSEQRRQSYLEGETYRMKDEEWDLAAKELAKVNGKYSAKDRKEHMKKCREIRNEKLEKVSMKYLRRLNRPWKEQMELEKQVIELNADAREEFLKAKMVDKKELEVDLQINKVRKYYRLIRMYISHSRDKSLTEKERRSLVKEQAKVQRKLDKMLAKINSNPDESLRWKFSWAHMVGGDVSEEADREKERKVVLAAPVEEVNEEQEAKEVREDIKKKEISAARMHFFRTGIWDPNGKKEPKEGEEKADGWLLGSFEKLANEQIFTLDFESDESFQSTLKLFNENIKRNMTVLSDVDREENDEEIRRNLEISLKDEIDADAKAALKRRSEEAIASFEAEKERKKAPIREQILIQKQKMEKAVKLLEENSKKAGELTEQIKNAPSPEAAKPLQDALEEAQQAVRDYQEGIDTATSAIDGLEDEIKQIDGSKWKEIEPTKEEMDRQLASSRHMLVEKKIEELEKAGLDTKGRMTNKRLQDRFLTQLREFCGKMEEQGDENEIWTQKEYRRIEHLVNLNIPEVNQAIRAFYRKRMSDSPWILAEDGVSVMTTFDDIFRDQKDRDMIEKVRVFSRRIDRLEKDLSLAIRGDEIYQSKAIRALITGREITEADYEALKAQVRGVDELTQKMVQSRYSALTSDEILRDLRVFIGDKALFADYRTVRDLSERYLRGVGLTNRKAAKMEEDFESAYRDAVTGVFADHFRESSAWLLKLSQATWKGETDRKGHEIDPEKGRTKRMKKRLGIVSRVDSVLTEETENVTLSKKGWQQLLKNVNDLIGTALYRQPKLEKDEEWKSLEDQLRDYFKKVIAKVDQKDKQENQNAYRLKRGEFITGSKWQKGKPAKKISAEDYSFAGLFRGEGLLGTQEIEELIPDKELRSFLGDNLGSVILNNAELTEKFPFLKDIKGVDELDTLSVTQFNTLLAHVKENLLNEETKAGIKDLLKDSSADIVTGKVKDHLKLRKYVLLEVMRTRTDKEGVKKLIRKELNREDDNEELQRKRIQLAIVKKGAVRDGKIRYRYEDMPDLNKNILEKGLKWAFNTGTGWLEKRLAAFEEAERMWKLMDEKNPELALKLRGAFKEILKTKIDDKDAVTKFERLGNALEGQKGAKALDSAVYSLTDADVYELKEFFSKLDPELFKEIAKIESAEGKLEQKRGSRIPVKDFLLEMAMVGTEDIVFGHGGQAQNLLFTYQNPAAVWKDDKYKLGLVSYADMALKRMDILEKSLEPYKKDPKLYAELKDRLMPYYLNLAAEETIKQTEITRKGDVQEKLLNQTKKDIESKEAEIRELTQRRADLKTKKADLEKEQSNLKKTIEDKAARALRNKSIDEEIKSIDKKRKELKKTISNLEDVLEEAQNQYKKDQAVHNKFIKDNEGQIKKTYDEYQANSGKFGVGSFRQLENVLESSVNKNGEFSHEVCDLANLYESRRNLFSSYGKGELAQMWDIFEKNDAVFTALMDPAQSVAEAKIKELYETFAPLGEAMKGQYEFVGFFYAEDNIPKLLEGTEPGAKSTLESLKGQTFKQKVELFRGELNRFHDAYTKQTHKDSGSIVDNISSASGDMVDDITEYYLNTARDLDYALKVKKEDGYENKRSGVKGIYDKAKQGLYEANVRAQKQALCKGRAEQLMMQVRYQIENDPTMIQKANDEGTLKAHFKKIADRFKTNDSLAEKRFIEYVFNREMRIEAPKRDMFGAGSFDEEFVNRIIGQMSEQDQQRFFERIALFKSHVREHSLAMDEKEFNKKIDGFVKSFVTKSTEALEADESFTERFREGAKKRIEEREAAGEKSFQQKRKGQIAYSDVLFGGKLDELAQFGATKRSLANVSRSGKNNDKVASKGEEEDKEIFRKAKGLFKQTEQDETVYPDILADCLDEYIRMNSSILKKIDRAADWIIREDDEVDIKAKHLKQMYKYVKNEGNVPEEAMDLCLTYVARFADNDTDLSYKSAVNDFKAFYQRIHEVEQINVTSPLIKNAHRDACEKLRAMLFTEKDKSPQFLQKLDDMVANQKAFFAYADKCYPVIEEVVRNDGYLKTRDPEDQVRYVNGLWEVLLEDMIRESTDYFTGKKEFDKEAFRAKAAEQIKDSGAREALLVRKSQVSYLDFEEKNILPGAFNRADFEHALVTTNNEKLLAEYNAMDTEQRKLFAMALYCSRPEQRGTMRVLYGNEEELKAERSQLHAYVKGEDVSFKVDYGKAMRALTVRGKGVRVKADENLFFEAADFVKKIERKKNLIRPKEWSRMRDSVSTALAADRYRAELGGNVSKFTTQKQELDTLEIDNKQSFFAKLAEYQKTDSVRQDEDKILINFGENIKKAMKRIEGMSDSQKDLLIYVLQDRTVLDFSTAGPDEKTKVTPHANSDKRFKVFESLLSEKGRIDALHEAASPDAMMRAMRSLFSFQLKDDKELTQGKLTKEDFAEGSLKRIEAVDWSLLVHALDFVDEIENERIRLAAVRRAGSLVRNAPEGSKDAPIEFYRKFHTQLERGSSREQQDQLESLMREAYGQDRGFFNDTEVDDLMTGFSSLTPQEKNLFFRALENRDILDISQKNLYRNVFGMAERDYVNPKGRDELIEEFLNGNGTIELKSSSYQKAFLSLVSTQLNDDMSFEDMKTLSDPTKKLTVDNQWFVKKRSTVFDWKLFKRALQFVTRTVNERKLAIGDEETYKALGDQSNGEMSFDRKYLRRNLHHTGNRFMRFLAKEGYDAVEDKLSYLDTAANYADYVVSQKVSNFLHNQTNIILKKDFGGDKEEEDDDDKPEELEVEQHKSADEIAAEEKEKKEKEEAKAKYDEEAAKLRDKASKIVEQQLQIVELQQKQKEQEEKIKNGENIPEKDKVVMIPEDQIIKMTDEELEKYKKVQKQDNFEDHAKQRKEMDHSNIIVSLAKIAGSYDEQKKALKQISKTATKTYKDYKKLFTGEEDDDDDEVEDALGILIKDVKVEERKQGITGNETADYVIEKINSIAGMKEKMDEYLLKQENVDTFEEYCQTYLKGKISFQGVSYMYDNVEFKMESADKWLHDKLLPDWLKSTVNSTLDVFSTSEEFLKNVSTYVGEAGEVLATFRDAIEAGMNIHKLSKAKDKAKDAREEDAKKLASGDRETYDMTMVERAVRNNISLMETGNDMTKQIQGRVILNNAGKLANRALYYAGRSDIGTIVNAAVRTASFIWQCMSDNKAIYSYYQKGGNEVLAKLYHGRDIMQNTPAGQRHMKREDMKMEKNGEYFNVDSRAFDLIRNGQGFERDEELADYLRLNLVHSMIFSASKFNPIEESRILAECTLTVLGFEKEIGKADSETASKIFLKLKE